MLQEQLRQKKEYDIVIGERDILGTQLIRRNDELALLYEKIKIQQSTLNKGQLQYRDRSVPSLFLPNPFLPPPPPLPKSCISNVGSAGMLLNSTRASCSTRGSCSTGVGSAQLIVHHSATFLSCNDGKLLFP